MEPIITGSLVWILTQVGTGFACNRGDFLITAACQFGFKGFINYLKTGNLPVNHDLQKAVRRSLLKAQKAIAEDYQEELGAWFPPFGQYLPFNKQRDNLRWVNRKLEQLNRELKQVNNVEYEEMSAELLDEIALLLTPEGILNAGRIAETKQQLLEAVLQGDEPAEFAEKLKRDRDGLFDLLCANFADEIKNNKIVSGIFDSQLLAQINSKLTGEPVTLEELESCLSNVTSYLQEISRKQDEWGKRIVGEIHKIQPPTSRQVVRPNNTPYRAKIFVGRDRDLDNLHQTLQQCDRVAVTAITGMGGIGKSELAIQYAHRYGEFYPGGIWFFDGASGNLESQILQLAQLNLGLDIPQKVGNSQLTLAQQVQWCWNNWPIADRVLLVWDDIAELDSIAELLPREPRFRVLLTTRDLQLAANFTPISLDVLLPEKALELLRELTRDNRIESESAAAANLCEWLGYLPLGIELVGRYLALDPDLSVAEMWERLQAQSLEDEAIDLPQSSMMTAQRGVKAAIELSWRKLDDGVADIARLLGVFAPAAIAWDWVKSVAKLLNGWETEVDNARKQLYNQHLIQRIDTGIYTLHPLIREFLRSEFAHSPQADEIKRAFASVMVEIAKTIPNTPTLKEIEEVTPAIPHLAELGSHLREYVRDEDILVTFTSLGRFYQGQGRYNLAEPWFEKCVSVVRDRLGEEHPSVATSLNNLALLYESQGRYESAEPLYLQALELYRCLLGEQHPYVATSLNNLALLYESQGRYESAEALYLQALELYRRLLGEQHPSVATSLNNLAGLYSSQGRYESAEPLYLQVLELRRRLLGEQHPDVATSLNNLAAIYESQGRYEDAEPLYLQALELRRRLLGEQHPDVATSLNNLALLYESQGRYEKAEPLYLQALEIVERRLGEQHPNVGMILNNLAYLYKSQGRYESAEALYLQALELYRRLLGEQHPSVATSLNNLAGLYSSQGRYESAEPLYLQVLELRRRLLGEQHPDVATSLNNLAAIYESQGRYEDAEPLYLQALELRRRLLGEQHPDVATSLNNLALLYSSQGRYEDAEPLYLQALELKRRLLGEQHPDVAISLNNLAGLYKSQRRYEDAEPLYLQALEILEGRLGVNHPNTIAVRNNLDRLRKQRDS